MSVKIRPATENDIESILEIVNFAILHTTANYNYEPQSFEVQMEWFHQKQAHDFPVIVAELENQVVGFGAYGTFREKIGYQFTVEHSVYVSDVFIGKGIGKQLLAELIAIAKKQNLRTMIGAIDAENSDSIAFHEKFGFTKCGVIKDAAFKFDRWLNLQLMQLILN
ncbi:N-acetyltransferase [Flavobacterium noncentrifugens]|uniref:Phosphinothricin acetyltransferase n=1 Tax=Flavobacterium noncentrifugens TaxID=1128970 RepID=A0A1G8WKA4_9FLAO|nr:GNAT family N-acetyltransferase [Flavobacterium noncentrifugens]GEP50967.1 N-acetyltransferase [Flavobacterium noncentrifugens]SDJ78782.1 phosphinothricin acetyltransferase [Flavobacterium noncentrifugens]